MDKRGSGNHEKLKPIWSGSDPGQYRFGLPGLDVEPVFDRRSVRVVASVCDLRVDGGPISGSSSRINLAGKL